MAAGLLDRRVEPFEAVDLGDAHGGAAPGGLDEQRPAVLPGEVHDPLAYGGGVAVPLARADHLVRSDRQPEGEEDALHVLLVLADGRGEDARADVGHTGEFQQPLERAVLPVRAVQHGEDDVDLTERLGHRAGFAVDDLTAARVDREDDAALGGLRQLGHVGDLAVGDGHAFGLISGERPAAVRRDADRQDVVLRPVDGLHDGAGRDDRDAVFGAAAAEHDSHTRLAALLLRALGALRALGEVLAAHIAMSVPAGRGGVSVARPWRSATSAPSPRRPGTCPRERSRRRSP